MAGSVQVARETCDYPAVDLCAMPKPGRPIQAIRPNTHQ